MSAAVYEAGPIAQASVSIEELEAAIRAENERRYAFYRMLHATDRVLWRLEEWNQHGVKRIPAEWRGPLREALNGLPESCLEAYRDSDKVQEVLDGIFDVQDRLFAWHDPQRLPDEDYEGEVVG